MQALNRVESTRLDTTGGMGAKMVKERVKAKKPKIPKGQQERMLTDKRACPNMDSELRRQTLKKLQEDKRNLRRIVPVCPDSPWFTAHWEHMEPFPPAGDATKMRMCHDCSRYTPPQCISARDICLDCQHEYMSEFELEHLPTSGSGINLAKWKAAQKAGKQYDGGF